MRIVIPQQQIENLHRALLLNMTTSEDEASVDSITGSMLNQADKLCQNLYSQWEKQSQMVPRPSEVFDLFMDELEKLNDINLWKTSRIDLILNHKLFNIIDEILELAIEKLEQGAAEANGSIETKLQKVMKFLKVILIYASNIQYFSSTERITRLYELYQERHSLNMVEELLGVLITISSKINEKKLLHPQANLSNNQNLDSFNTKINQVKLESQGLIKSFDFIADLLIGCQKESTKIDIGSLIDQKVSALLQQAFKQENPDASFPQPDIKVVDKDFISRHIKTQEKIYQLNMLLTVKPVLTELKFNPYVMTGSKEQNPSTQADVIEGLLIQIIRRINLYLNVGDTEVVKDKFRQTTKLEQLLPPKLFINKLIDLLRCPNLSKRIHIQSMNILFLFVILDMNQIFSYIQPADNQYYQEACLHHEIYNEILQKMARYHAYEKLRESKVYQSNEELKQEEKMDVDQTNLPRFDVKEFLEHQRQLVGGDSTEEEFKVTDTVKSHRFLNSFLNFLFHLLIFKNRTLQTQLYPQFLKPLLALINVKPNFETKVYPINISCQLKAVKLLKEVVKLQSIDDPTAVERVVDRLKEEIRYLHDVDTKWIKMPDDDSESDILNIYRQDMIRTLLRFLSYTIIRNDPNAINFTQNFIANSRKILDSNLIQHDMLKYIFDANRTLPESFLTQVIDPVILQCIQLISYLFNDLPQKIPQFIDNGVFPAILASLAQRIPVQPDLISLLMKLVQTFCLNPQGIELVGKSGVLEAFARVACDSNAHKLFVNQNKVIVFSDTIQAVLGQSKELAKSFLVALLKNYDTLMTQTWKITRYYADMENCIAKEPEMSKSKKEMIRIKYDKQQLRLEQTFEAASNLLFFYFGDDNGTISNNMKEAVIENAELVKETIEKIVTTPLVASACSNMFPIFLESLITINSFLGQKYEEEFVDKIFLNIETQIKNLSLLLGNSSTFDDIDDVEKQITKKEGQFLNLFEGSYGNNEYQKIIDDLKPEDIVSVVFAKLALYCEIVSKCINTAKNKLLGSQNEQVSNIAFKVFKIQSMINRYHACIYEREIVKDLEKLKELLKTHQSVIDSTDFAKFTPYKHPEDDQEIIKNLYFKYEYEKIPTIMDKKARESFKTTIEVSLDENISHTSNMCQHSNRKLINGLLRSLNRQKSVHFSNDIDPKILKFNQMIGKLIAEEFLDFKKVEQISKYQTQEVRNTNIKAMRFFCQTSAVFSEFNRVLFGSFSSGVLLIEFIENKGFECIKEIVRWFVKYLYDLEKDTSPKNLYQFKNFQLLFSHIIDFFVQLIEGRYLDQQYQHFLIAFKPNPAQGLPTSAPSNLPKETLEKNEQELKATTQRLKDYFMSLSIETIHFIFVELNSNKYVNFLIEGQRMSVFEYFDQISEIFLVSMVDIYGFLCKGLQNNKSLTGASGVLTSNGVSQILRPFSSDPNDMPIDREIMHSNLRQLVEMGFDEQRARVALNNTQNSMTWASELLLSNAPELDMPLPENSIWAEPAPPQVSQIVVEEKSSLVLPQEEENKEIPVFQMSIVQNKHFSRKELYRVIALSFKDYLNFNPITLGKLIKKSDVIDNIFFKMGNPIQAEETQISKNMLSSIKDSVFELITECHLSKDFNNMGYMSICLTNMLSYRHGHLVQAKQVFQAVFEILDLFRMTIARLKEEISYKESSSEIPKEKWDKTKEKYINDIIRQIEFTIQLFMYVTEEGKISSDLIKLNNIIGLKPGQQLDQSVLDIQQSLDVLQQKNKDNLFNTHKEQTAEIFQKEILMIIELFKALHSMDPQIEKLCESGIHEIVLRSLETLNFLVNIKGFADFDCQSCFLQNEGLRALFGIRILSKETFQISQLHVDSKKQCDIQIQSKTLLQMLSQNEHTQIKVYENLIKSVLFIYFQERYKLKEGQDIAAEFIKDDKQAYKQTHSSTKPKQVNAISSSLLSPDKKLSAKQGTEASKVKPQNAQQSALAKQTLLKKADHGEVLLDEFIQFFNSVMQIQDFRSFLQACQNVCLIVQKQKNIGDDADFKVPSLKEVVEKANGQSPNQTSDNNKDKNVGNRASRAKRRRENKEVQMKNQEEEKKEDVKEVEQQFYVVLTQGSMRDMINQYEQNFLQQPTIMTVAEQDKLLKGHIQQFQQEIVYTLLDQFIEQIRDQQMLILQHSKQRLNPSPMGIDTRIDSNNGHLIIKNSNDEDKASHTLSYQRYLLDFTQILSHLTFMATHSPILIRALLRHKEGKTLKFIIRNLYYLLTMVITPLPNTQGQYKVQFDHNALANQKKLIDIVNEFFKRVMFDNPHLTANERRAKLEARVIFQKEVLRNLTDHAGPNHQQAGLQKYPLWPQLRTVYNLGALWLLSVVFTQESIEQKPIHQDKQIENIIMQMQNYRNIYRNIMIKNIIIDCQTQFNNQKGNSLSQSTNQEKLQLIRVLQMIQQDVVNHLTFFNTPKEAIQICIQSLYNILLPFEQNSKLLGAQEQDQLGFVPTELSKQLKSDQLSSNQQEEVKDEEMNQDNQASSEEEEEDEEEDNEDDEDSEDSDDDLDEEDDELLDSELSERNFRFSQQDNNDDMIEDQNEDEQMEDEDDYGDEDLRLGNRLRQAGGGHRHHHHHHHHRHIEDPHNQDESDEEDDDDEEDNLDEEDGEDEEVEEMQIIHDLLQRGPSQRELEMIEDELDEEEEEDEVLIDVESSSEPSQQARRPHSRINSQPGGGAAADQPLQNREGQEEGKDEEDDYDDEFEDEYDEEEGGEEDSEEEDDYYDEEIDDDDQEQVQIYVGRNPDHMDRLSDLRQQVNQGGAFRRDDLMSLNNLSVDMLNMGGAHRRDQDNANDEGDGGSADFSAADNDLGDNESQDQGGRIVGRRNDLQNSAQIPVQPPDAFDDLIGYILGSHNSNNAARPRSGAVHVRRQDSSRPADNQTQQKDDIAYKPVQTMLDIVSLGKQMQIRQNIYQSFIKEALIDQSKAPINQPAIVQPQLTNQVMQSTSNEQQQQMTQGPKILNCMNPFASAQIPERQQPNNNSGNFDFRNLSGYNMQPNQRAQQMLPDEEEIDPEFMANLDQSARLNIQQTEDLMNFISNQSNRQESSNVYSTVQMIQSVTNREERQTLFRNLPDHIFNYLPSTLYSEGLIYRTLERNQQQQPVLQISHSVPARPIAQISGFLGALRPQSNLASSNFQGVGEMRIRGVNGSGWNHVRSRLHSMDQQLNDITDFSRQQNDPYVRNNNENEAHTGLNSVLQFFNQPSSTRMVQNMVVDRANVEDNSIYVNFNSYLRSHIDEMKKKPILDSKGEDIGQACEQLINTVYLKNITEITEQNLAQVLALIDMIIIWIKYLTTPSIATFVLQKEQKLMNILLKVPNLRNGLLLRVIQWLFQGIDQLQIHDQDLNKKSQGDQVVTVDTPQKQFMVTRGSGLPGQIDIYNFVLQCLRCLKFLSSDGKTKKGGNLYGTDLLKIPQTDSNLKALIQIVNNQASADQPQAILKTKDSLITQIIEWMVNLLSLISHRPAYILSVEQFDQEEYEGHWDEILSNMSGFFKQIVVASKQKSGKQVGQVIDTNVVQRLCTLILSNEFKKKSTQKNVRSILTQVANLSGEGQLMIEQMFKESLNVSLKRFIGIIEESKIDMEQLKKEVVVINQILKFSKQNNAKNETNICDQDLFFKVVKVVSNLIERKNFEHVSSSLQQAAFMFKEDFRTIMTTLFILFEYNLKFIFTESQEVPQVPPRRGGRNGGPQQQFRRRRNQQNQGQYGDIQVMMQDSSAIKEEIANEINNAIHSKDKDALMHAIDQHLAMKIKDEKAREDQKLKVFIRFCLENKKVINSFIRANQQVLNESLRNVIIKVPQVLDFDNKRLLFRSQIKKMQKKYRLKYFDIQVRRDKVFDDSYEQLKHLQAERWKGQMNVEFADEQGIDEGGLTREWFILLSQEIFNPDLALFLQSNAGSTYYPNPKSVVQPEYISLFRFIGRIVGKALYEQQLLDCYFVKALYKIILGLPLTYHDVEDFDNDVYRNLKWCLDNSVEHLGLMFAETRDYFGQNEEIELIEGGKDKEVTDENKYEYVQCMAYQKLYNSIKVQVDAFLQGFYDIVPKQLVQIFDNRELELLISGLPNIDIMDLKENTVYQNYTAETPVVKWLFEVLEEFENSERAEFIQFVTGSSKVPVEGFKGLRGSRGLQKFQIVKFFTNDTNRLPQAHTCFKQLELPEYTSKQQLKDRLLTAIKEGKTFGFA